jgi:hypothetical protein
MQLLVPPNRESMDLAAVGLFDLMTLLQVSWDIYAIYKNPDKNTYLPAVAFLRGHAGSAASIIGSGELGLELEFVPWCFTSGGPIAANPRWESVRGSTLFRKMSGPKR